ELLRFIDERRLSTVQLPTAYWHELTADLAHESRSLPHSLRIVVVGGEAARPEAVARWRELSGERIRWINAYGPTETTVTSIAFEPTRGEPLSGGSIPIGRPLANSRAYVLDRAGTVSPVGLPGELVIGGESVARG